MRRTLTRSLAHSYTIIPSLPPSLQAAWPSFFADPHGVAQKWRQARGIYGLSSMHDLPCSLPWAHPYFIELNQLRMHAKDVAQTRRCKIRLLSAHGSQSLPDFLFANSMTPVLWPKFCEPFWFPSSLPNLLTCTTWNPEIANTWIIHFTGHRKNHICKWHPTVCVVPTRLPVSKYYPKTV